MIRDDGLAILTDACIYSLIVEHYIVNMSFSDQVKLGRLETICCKTAAAVREYDGKVPSNKAKKEDYIFALGMSIWMVSWVTWSRSVRLDAAY